MGVLIINYRPSIVKRKAETGAHRHLYIYLSSSSPGYWPRLGQIPGKYRLPGATLLRLRTRRIERAAGISNEMVHRCQDHIEAGSYTYTEGRERGVHVENEQSIARFQSNQFALRRQETEQWFRWNTERSGNSLIERMKTAAGSFKVSASLFLFHIDVVFFAVPGKAEILIPRYPAPRRHVFFDALVVGLNLEHLAGPHLFDLARGLKDRHGTGKADTIEHFIGYNLLFTHMFLDLPAASWSR